MKNKFIKVREIGWECGTSGRMLAQQPKVLSSNSGATKTKQNKKVKEIKVESNIREYIDILICI
jgi:hypothetical protein